ncbi:Glycolipid transfer protein, partial [Clarias magur]
MTFACASTASDLLFSALHLRVKGIPASHLEQREQQRRKATNDTHLERQYESVTHLPPALDCDLKLHLVSVEASSHGNIQELYIPGAQRHT